MRIPFVGLIVLAVTACHANQADDAAAERRAEAAHDTAFASTQARGEMAMVIALVGLSMGIIGQDAFISIIMASLICTIITPFLLKDWLFREKHEYPEESR